MTRKIILSICLLCIAALGFAQKPDAWHQVGFKIGTSLPLNREYSERGDNLDGLVALDFGAFFRAGRYVYGEVGLGYGFYKATFKNELIDEPFKDELVETRHLLIPVKVVGNVRFGRACAFLPYAGIVYQPLLQVSDNNINFSKENITRHSTLLTTGFDLKLGFIVLGVNYRYSFQTYFQNQNGKHPQYLNICAGFQF